MLVTACQLLERKGAFPGPTSDFLWPFLGILRGLAMGTTVQEAGTRPWAVRPWAEAREAWLGKTFGGSEKGQEKQVFFSQSLYYGTPSSVCVCVTYV